MGGRGWEGGRGGRKGEVGGGGGRGGAFIKKASRQPETAHFFALFAYT